jgi:RimJ/RimL family protein N-acetyltransferase
MFKAPTITAKNFVLKAIDLVKDKKDMIKNINDPEILYMIRMDYPYNKISWNEFVKWHKNMWSGKEADINWMIYVDNECVGSVNIKRYKSEFEQHSGEIGYWLAKKYWG